MSAPNSLSSLSGSVSSHHHPIILVWPAVEEAASSGILPSPTFLRRRHINNRHHHSSLPNWTRLSGGGNNHDDDAKQGQQSEQPSNNNQQQRLAATYSTPQAASAAYNSGLLKSDYNISSNALRIRVAFRYTLLISQLQHNKEDEQKSEQDDDNIIDDTDLFLYICWIRQDGIPCHFRKLMPVMKNNSSNKSTEESAPAAKRLRGGKTATIQVDESEENVSEDGDSDVRFVNEQDVIESTFPGHAFVFCRRIANYNHRNRIDDDDDDDIKISTRVVHDNDGHTMFLRRQKKQRKDDDVESDGSSSSSEKEEEELQEERKGTTNKDTNNDKHDKDDDEWEAYLVVGGFRPGPMPRHSSQVVEGEAAETNRIRSVDSEEEKRTDDDSDDASDDEMKLQAQLVTIRRSKMSIPVDNQQDHVTTSLRAAKSETTSAVDTSKSLSQLDQTIDDLVVTVRLAQIDPTPVDISSKHYDQVTLGGWPCRIEPGCFGSSDKDSSENDQRNSLQSRFETDITVACQSLPPMAREKLQQSTPLWINKSHMWGPKVAPIRGRDACFHPGASWLSRNGDTPLKCGGVEFHDAKHYLSDCDDWGPGGLILHELSHAWHNIHIDNGYDNELIKKCYELAMKDGLYDCVRVHGPQGPECRAYACTDPMEYFAELSVAFLGGLDDTREHNKWFPFNRSQLREHDPRAFDMMCRMWGVAVVDDNDGANTNMDSERGEDSKET